MKIPWIFIPFITREGQLGIKTGSEMRYYEQQDQEWYSLHGYWKYEFFRGGGNTEAMYAGYFGVQRREG